MLRKRTSRATAKAAGWSGGDEKTLGESVELILVSSMMFELSDDDKDDDMRR